MSDLAARLATLRHDLRTPLNHIIGYTELLQEDASSAQQPDLQRIHDAAHELLQGLDAALELVAEVVEEGSRPAAARPSPAPRPAPQEALAEGPAEEGTLLVVDDNDANRDLLVRRLRRLGFTVEPATEGEEALQKIAVRRFDLVLLDIMMPGIDGLEVLRRVRQTHSLTELPVIMATAKDGSADVVEALALGANDHVAKPINLPVLVARARTQLELRRAHERIRALVKQLETRNVFIREVFGRYLTEEVVESLLETPGALALGGETRTATILLSDLRGFSSLAERLSPPEVISLLNGHLAAMTEIISRHGGTIDEFIGDAILVIFGAPTARSDDARRAVVCAVEMQLGMEGVNACNVALGLPALEMGIGINTGEVVVGNIGSQRRAKYGVVGRHVNLAARIQDFSVGGQVLVSEATLEAAGPGLRVDGVIDVCPKGSTLPMRIYEIGGVGAPHALALPQSAADLVPLARPLRARFAVLDGISAPAPEHQATVTHLSPRAARLLSEVPVSAMRTLRLELADDGASGAVAGDLYAKVLRVMGAGRELHVRFTTVSPPVEAALHRALLQARGPAA